MNQLPFFRMTLILFHLVALSCAIDLTDGKGRAGFSALFQERGRGLLESSVNAHGTMGLWRTKTTTTTRLTHEFGNIFADTFVNPWPDRTTRGTLHSINGNLATRIDFGPGRNAGQSWGVNTGRRTYAIDANAHFQFSENKKARFMLEALHYLNEQPFRLFQDAAQVGWLDTIRLHGREYNRVLTTWGKDFAPDAGYDQYILYIDTETNRLDYVEYTVREFARFARACMHFSDYRTVAGIQFAFTKTVTESCADEGNGKDFMHQVRIETLGFDEVRREFIEGGQ